MQLGQKINLRHSQSIVMTPQLRQAIKLLQFSNIELSQYVEEEMEKNPFLDSNDLEQKDGEKIKNIEEKTIDTSSAINTGISSNDDPSSENDIENRWDDDRNLVSRVSKRNISSENLSAIENRIPAPKKSLRSHLLEQILLDISAENERSIAINLLDLIEPSGWISADLKALSENNGLSYDKVQTVLQRLQKMDPCGVFARNLGECLRIQLEEQGKLNTQNVILTNNLDLLAKGEIKKLCKLTSLNESELSESINVLKKLNPKPAENFDNDNINIEPPDVIIERVRGAWKVALNRSTLPSLYVNENFAGQIKHVKNSDSDKKYIGDSINSARWLLRAIEQRNSTTLKVALEILKQQKNFFEKGPGHLKPLVLKDVAEAISMHESTISRVTRSKLLQTPWGLFQMKDFFSGSVGIAKEGKELYASKTVRENLKSLIENEPESKPYSDDELSKIMKERGIEVARRTVAKYREIMNIQSSAERRRIMRLNKVVNITAH